MGTLKGIDTIAQLRQFCNLAPEQFAGTVPRHVKPPIPLSGEAAKDMMLRLPWPPTLNNLFATSGNRRRLSERGRLFRAEVALRVRLCPRHVVGRIEVNIYAYPPDNRIRDLDNLQKAILDSLKHAGVIEDDGKIDRLSITRREVTKPGYVNVFIVGIQE